MAHLLIHLEYRSHFAAHASAAEANLLVAVLGVGAVISVALLALTFGPRAGGARPAGRSPNALA